MTRNLDPPAGLDPDTQKIWKDTLTQILEAGTIARLDPNSIHAYVTAVRNHQRATQLLTQTDILIDQNGKPTPNPALAIQTEAARTIAAFARQFRLNASHPGTPAQPADQPQEPTSTAKPMTDGKHAGTWCEQHHRWECHAQKSRNRGLCHGIATATGRCRSHMGRGGPAKLLVAELAREPTYGAPVQVTPEQALVQSLWRTAGHVKWLGERVAELETAALTWGQDRTVTRYWGEFPGSEVIRKAGPHVLLDLYDREHGRLIHLAAEMTRLGLAARLVDTAREQGAAYARCLDAILRDLTLTPDQQALVPEVVPRRLRELIPA